MRPIRRILVAVKDPSARSLLAVKKAAQLARATDAGLELFHGIADAVDLIVAERHATRHVAPWLLRFTDWELLRLSPVPVLRNSIALLSNAIDGDRGRSPHRG